MGSSLLDIAQWHAGVERGGDECAAQGVRPDLAGQPGAAGDTADESPGPVPVQAAAVGGEEDRSFAAFADGQVDRPGGPGCEGDDGLLAALAGDGQGAVAALRAQVLDIGAGGLRHP